MSRDTSSRLIRANLMTPVDSPNGRRWTHRDAKTGKSVKAYGFDLLPIGLHAEFVAVVARAVANERQ